MSSAVFSYRPSFGATYLGSISMPAQNVPATVKQSPEWQKANMDYFDNQANQQMEQKIRMLGNYRYLSNDIDQREEYGAYTDILGLGEKVKEQYGKTAKVEHFPICIRPFQTLLGEYIKRPLNYYVRNENPEARNEYYRVKGDMLFESVMAQVRARISRQLMAKGYDPESDEFEQEVQKIIPQRVQEYMDKDWVDTAEAVGQRILSNLWKKEGLDDVFLEGFKNAVITSTSFYHTYTVNGKTKIHDIHPLDVFYHKSPSVRWVSEGQYAGYCLWLTVSSIIDMFYGKLTKEDMDKIYQHVNPAGNGKAQWTGGNSSRQIHYDTETFSTASGQLNDRFVTNELQSMIAQHWNTGTAHNYMGNYGLTKVVIAYWKSDFPLYFLHDADGVKTIVDENYKEEPLLGEWIENLPMQQIYQGVKIHDDIYLDVKPYTDYPIDIEELEEQLLPIEGCVFNDTSSNPISMIDLMRPWNRLYDITADSLKKDMNSALGKVMLMSYDHMPNIPGFTKEKWLYWMRELRVMWIKQPKNGTASMFNQFTSIDMSFAEQMRAKMDILERLKMECDAIGGFAPQRIAGGGSPSQTLGESRQQLVSSVNQTEYLFYKHSRLVGRVLNYALNLSKRNAKYYGYMRNLFDDMEQAFIDFDEDLSFSKLGVYVTNSLEDLSAREKLDAYISLAVSNGADMVDMADMILARTMGEMRNVMEKLRRSRQESGQIEQRQKEAETELKKYEIDTKAQVEREKMKSNEKQTYMKTFAMQEENMKDTDDSGIADVLEYETFIQERLTQAEEINLKKRKQFMDEVFTDRKLTNEEKAIDAKVYDSTIKYKVAKENKNPGEKKK